MNQTCYLVALIDIETAKVERVGLYSHARPLHSSDKRSAVLDSCRADDFGVAYYAMLQTLSSPYWDWVRPFLTLPVGTTIPQLETEES